MKRIAMVVGSAFALLFAGLFVLMLIVAVTAEGGCGCSLSTGRAISAKAACYVSLESSKDTATIRTLLHTIVIAPQTLTVDGSIVGVIPADAKSIDVRVGWNSIAAYADGALIGPSSAATASASKAVKR